MKVLKKDNRRLEDYDPQKIIRALQIASDRVDVHLTQEMYDVILGRIEDKMYGDIIPVNDLHKIIINVLEEVTPKVAESYKSYRGYKQRFNKTFGRILDDTHKLLSVGDKENANKNSELISTKKELSSGIVSRHLALDYELPNDVAVAHIEGYIHSHDTTDEIFGSINCCLFDMKNLLKDGFTINGIKNTEPKHLETALDIISDVILSASSQQYGGFTVPEIDSVLAPYVEMGYNEYLDNFSMFRNAFKKGQYEKWVENLVYNTLKEGCLNKFDHRLNTINNSNGQTSFTTFTFGLDTTKWGRLVSKAILESRLKGLGVNKISAIFPKLVFLHREEINGAKDSPNYDIKQLAIECSLHNMYPDMLSLDAGYLGEIYDKYKLAISPMGCVEGREVITYKIDGKLFVESFKRMWDRITNTVSKDIGQSNNSDLNRLVELSNNHVEIWDTKENNFVKVTHLIRNVQSNWCEVTLSNGRLLKTTTDHPFETENRGVVLAKDLTPNDVIVINTEQYSEETIDCEEDLAWLLGFMLCDGCYQNYSVFVSIANEGEDDIQDYFIKTFSKCFGVTPKVVNQNRGKKGKYKDIRVYSDKETSLKMNDLINYFKQKYGGVQKIHRQIPNEVFSYNTKAKYSFLAGMIDADGYINNDLKKHKYPTVQIGSTNKELALQQLALAQSLGMKARIYKNHYTKDTSKIRYRVEFFPNKYLIEMMKCNKKKSKWTDFEFDTYNKHTSCVLKIEFQGINKEDYSYDVTTSSGHFEVSGVYSHNCRAYLSPYYKRGGMTPADDQDTPVFIGRANCGAVSLNLPRYAIEAQGDKNKFYEILDHYFWLCIKKHTYKYNKLRGVKASTNPLFFCEGGCHIKLGYNDTIEKAIKTFTWSIGYIGLEEVTYALEGKNLSQDNTLAIEILNHLNDLIEKAKKQTGLLIAMYATPAESLCYRFLKLDREKYGVIKGVTDKEYYTNSFHVDVRDNVSAFEKQDIEEPMFNISKGGRISYNEFPHTRNRLAIEQCINRAMKKGLYYGINLQLDTCLDCNFKGEFTIHKYHDSIFEKSCPRCGSKNVLSINRVCGYLGYTVINGESRMNEGKNQEILNRVDHFSE